MQHPVPGGGTLNDVHFVDASTGWAVGDDGVIIRSDRGGRTWVALTSGTEANLNAVHFVDSNTGWAVGAGGTILKTTNGSDWSPQNSGVTHNLNDVCFVDGNTGWAVGAGNTILRTTNGGASWLLHDEDGFVLGSPAYNAVHFISPTTGWAVGSLWLGPTFGTTALIRVTTDGGATWTNQTTGTDNVLHDVHFTSMSEGWAVGVAGTILHTTNGGGTWSPQDSGTAKTLYSVDADFLSGPDVYSGYAAGEDGTVRSLSLAGDEWSSVSIGTQNTLRSVNRAGRFCAVGESATIRFFEGSSWRGPETLGGVSFGSGNVGVSAGENSTILRTSNAGDLWMRWLTHATDRLNAVHMATSMTGWVVGDGGRILKTTNLGLSWTQQTSPTSNNLNDVYFADEDNGWAVGAGGTIVATTDGGSEWSAQTSNVTAHLTSVHFIDEDTGWAVGEEGVVLRTTTGGSAWTLLSDPVDDWVYWHTSAHFIDEDTGWVTGFIAMGFTSYIRKTTDGGATWETQWGTLYPPRAIQFVSEDVGWAVGDAGMVWATVDGGATWTEQESGTEHYLYDLWFVDEYTGWAVGSSGTILHYSATPPSPPPPVIPVEGANRWETAAAASALAFPDGADTVVIATGLNWPDALGGTALAGALDAPVLLVGSTVPAATAQEISRLGATHAVIVGGEAAVRPAVASALAGLGLSTERVFGTNRYKTAEAIAERVIAELGDTYDGTAFVATGANFPDAIAAAPLAAAQGWPLILAHPRNGLTPESEALLETHVDDALILGGTSVVPESVATWLSGEGIATTRLSGTNRYLTAIAIATYAVDEAGHSWDRLGIATGANFPDALAGGVVQGKVGSVMVLTPRATLHPAVAELIEDKADEIDTVTYFGGTSAVSQAVRDAVAAILE